MNNSRDISLDSIHGVYFIGIGGIGMSALARYFKAQEKIVCGYDCTASPLTKKLESEGIIIHYQDDPSKIPGIFTKPGKTAGVLIVYTPAVPESHSELCWFRQNRYHVLKRSEVLALIVERGGLIAVAGTHGKTTITAMIAHIMNHLKVPCTAFIGGIVINSGTNVILPLKQKSKGKGQGLFIAEADEYDRSFLRLHPDVAVISATDADHLDVYGSTGCMREAYLTFASQVKNTGTLIYRKGIPIEDRLKQTGEMLKLNYSLDAPADFYAEQVRFSAGKSSCRFRMATPSKIRCNVRLQVPGRHNVENAMAAIAAAMGMGVSANVASHALNKFRGVKRRFEYVLDSGDCHFIDDYAHHPKEIEACIRTVREIYPGKRVTGIFQPHLYSRTRDLAGEFTEALSGLDELILLEIYPAREKPIEGINSGMLLENVRIKNKMVCSKKQLVSEVKRRKPQVLLTMGAGDIDRWVGPIRDALKKVVE